MRLWARTGSELRPTLFLVQVRTEGGEDKSKPSKLEQEYGKVTRAVDRWALQGPLLRLSVVSLMLHHLHYLGCTWIVVGKMLSRSSGVKHH